MGEDSFGRSDKLGRWCKRCGRALPIEAPDIIAETVDKCEFCSGESEGKMKKKLDKKEKLSTKNKNLIKELDGRFLLWKEKQKVRRKRK